MSRPTYALIGGGVAGASAAEALRGQGFDGRVVLVGKESEPPYERPPLSKTILRGEARRESATLRTPEFYAGNSIELRLGEVVARLDVRNREIVLSGGETIAYDKVLVATGASPRRLAVPGGDLDGVHALRTLDDAMRLADALLRRAKVLVVGSGFIGCEVAASARHMGCDVVVVGPTLPMERALGAEIGALYAGYHRDRGVVVKSGLTVVEFVGTTTLEGARLSDGSTVACDCAVVGIGVVPSVSWLDDSLQSRDGIATDEFCRTAADGVFAAGDAAFSWRPRLERRVRLEHFDNAELQGAAAGRSMCGTMAPFDPLPFFWSDQYDISLQYYGFAPRWDRVVVRGRPADGSFGAFYLTGDRIAAACLVNRSAEANLAKRLIGRSDVSPRDLADADVSLKSLVSAQTRPGDSNENIRV